MYMPEFQQHEYHTIDDVGTNLFLTKVQTMDLSQGATNSTGLIEDVDILEENDIRRLHDALYDIMDHSVDHNLVDDLTIEKSAKKSN